MTKLGEDLIESLRQAAAHTKGRKVPHMRVTTKKVAKAPRARILQRVIPGSSVRPAPK